MKIKMRMKMRIKIKMKININIKNMEYLIKITVERKRINHLK